MNLYFRRTYRIAALSPLLMLANCTPVATSQIQTIDSFEQVRTQLENVDAKTLVVFDCDETLTIASEKLLQEPLKLTNSTIQGAWAKFKTHLKTKPNAEAFAAKISSQAVQKSHYRLVEPCVIDIIKNLQARGVKVIALTYQETGLFGVIPRLEQWRHEKLKSVGIDLSQAFDQQDITLSKCQPYNNHYPVYYKGILCANILPKGDVLNALLDHLDYKPSQVIFFDDKLKHPYLESVAQAMKMRGVPFKGYVYTAAYKNLDKVDPAIIQFQTNYIRQHEIYITEDEAVALMEKEPACQTAKNGIGVEA